MSLIRTASLGGAEDRLQPLVLLLAARAFGLDLSHLRARVPPALLGDGQAQRGSEQGQPREENGGKAEPRVVVVDQRRDRDHGGGCRENHNQASAGVAAALRAEAGGGGHQGRAEEGQGVQRVEPRLPADQFLRLQGVGERDQAEASRQHPEARAERPAAVADGDEHGEGEGEVR